MKKKLDKPKKKKRVILWWSAAACLLLGLLLPSVLHFNSTSGIKNIGKGAVENNNVVVDGKKDNLNSNKTIETPTSEDNPGKNTPENQLVITEDSTSSKNNSDQVHNSQKTQNQETAVAQSDNETKTNSNVLAPKSNFRKTNSNQPATEKAVASGKENTFKTNQSNNFNSASKNQFLNADKKASNQSVAEKTFNTGNANGFNSNSKNQFLNADKKAANQIVAEKTFSTGKTNSFNSNSKNQVLSADKKAANQILAEKTFNAGKTNAFNSNLKNQVSSSIFEDQLNSKNNKNIASNSFLNEKGKAGNENISKQNNETLVLSKELASNQKNNSKFTDVLSKQDSVQLAELQNLEKGIVTPETKKEKDNKKISKGEKWAVEVFAGLANSENYKNDKTLGNVNDSKQGSAYGVKTKYRINNKWAVGSGFKINELGQSIANISYVSTNTYNTAFYSSNDYFNINPTSVAPQISTNSGYIFVSTNTTNALKQNNIQNNSIDSGKLDQSLRYIEMPLEVSYAVFSKNKATVNLNTGGFVGKLISNNMALNGNSIGENVNANDYVYGSTLSSTIQYRVYKKTSVFVEPAMNYYLNPLNNQSFNQFQWGLNFGLNVSF